MTFASSFCFFLIAGALLPPGPAPEEAATIYLLHDAKKNLWCGYHGERAWRAAIGEVGAMETATIEFAGGVPKVVKVTAYDDSGAGAWIVFDRYYLNNQGEAMSLQRTTNMLADDVSRKEVFESRAGGRLALQHVNFRSIDVDTALVRSSAAFPKRPMATRGANFPFGALIERAQEVLVQDSVCVSPREVIEDKPNRR